MAIMELIIWILFQSTKLELNWSDGGGMFYLENDKVAIWHIFNLSSQLSGQEVQNIRATVNV